MKNTLATLFLLLVFFSAKSQHISVKSFKKLNDMDARINNPIIDDNGEKCALIKIVTTQKEFVFEGDALGISKIKQKTGEIWLYVPNGARRLTIKHAQLGVLRDYIYKVPIDQATSYELVLITGEVLGVVRNTLPSQWVVITSKPDSALVYLNNELKGTTPFKSKIKAGTYTFNLEKDLYYKHQGSFTLDLKQKKELDINLKPAFGSLNVKTIPVNNATIIIDGKSENKKSPYTFKKIKSGKHKISILHKLYKPYTQEFIIKDNEVKQMEINLIANFSDVKVTEVNNLDIYINGQNKGKNWNGNLVEGIHTIETKDAKYYNQKKEVEIIAGQSKIVELQSLPKIGNLDIDSKPFNANVYLNNEYKGKTPLIISELLIGEYHLRLEKENYGTLNKKVYIEENKTNSIEEELPVGTLVKINCSVANAKVYDSGKYLGETPLSINLNYGEHSLKIVKGTENTTKLITVKENNSNEFYFNMHPNKAIFVSSNPKGAMLYVDNKFIGYTPQNLRLKSGFHTISIKAKNYTDFKTQLNLSNSSKTNYTFNLKRNYLFKSSRKKSKDQEKKMDNIFLQNNMWDSSSPEFNSCFALLGGKGDTKFYFELNSFNETYSVKVPFLFDLKMLNNNFYFQFGFLDFLEFSENYNKMGIISTGLGFGVHSEYWRSVFYFNFEASAEMVFNDKYHKYNIKDTETKEYKDESYGFISKYGFSLGYKFNLAGYNKVLLKYGIYAMSNISKIVKEYKEEIDFNKGLKDEIINKGLNLYEPVSYFSVSYYF